MKKLLFLLWVLLATVILLEIGVRLWGYSAHYIYEPIYMPFDGSAEIPYVHRPNLHDARARGGAIINTDSLGLRSLASGTTYGAKKKNECRIAITGDSVTFGEGIANTRDVYPVVLEKLLEQRRPERRIRVFNFAVSAYSVRQMVATLRHRMLKIEPDLVVMAVIPADFDLSRTGTVDRWGYTAHTGGSSGLAGRDSLLKRLLRQAHLTYVLRDILRQRRERQTADSAGRAGAAVPASYTYLKAFAAIANSRHLPYLVLLLPSLHQGFSPAFVERLRQDRIRFLDLGFVVREFPQDRFMASRFDSHPSAAVHARIARLLADELSGSVCDPPTSLPAEGGQ